MKIDPEFRFKICGVREEIPYDTSKYQMQPNPELPEAGGVKLAANEKEVLLLELFPMVAKTFLTDQKKKAYEATAAKDTPKTAARSEHKVEAKAITGHKVTAPLPGKIIALKVKVGDKVKAGQEVVILEATKVIPESSFPDAGGPAEPDESGETDESGKTDESGEPHQSYAQMLVKPDYFPREGDENDKPVTGNADGTDTDSTAVPQNANESRSESQDDEESAPEQAASSQSQDLPKLPHRPSPSGLSVSGTVRFTPPPESSPTFDGNPRLIRGYIAVEGYVMGDGTLVLDEAPFAVKHS